MAVFKVFLDIASRMLWGFFDFQMIEVGHLTQASLKTILFRKNFRMSEATNKDFSSGEINSIIMGETGIVWQFVWSLSDYFECPLDIMVGLYYIYYSVGWCSVIALVSNLGFMYYYKKKGDKDQEKRKKIRQLDDQRNTYTVESLTNIKTLKLYGWEQKFKNKIEGLYQESTKMQEEMEFDTSRKIVEFLEHVVRTTMELGVFGLYFYLGNTVSITTMSMARMGMGRLFGQIHRIRHLYNEVFNFSESMERLMNFYTAPEAQNQLVKREDVDAEGDVSVKVNGFFSYGVTPCKDYDEKKA